MNVQFHSKAGQDRMDEVESLLNLDVHPHQPQREKRTNTVSSYLHQVYLIQGDYSQ